MAAIRSRPGSARIHPTGVFDGSRAMQILDILRRQHAADAVEDFSDVEGFEVSSSVRHPRWAPWAT